MLKFIPIVAISMSAFLAAGAAANAQSGAASGQVLSGDAAFGDWSKDAPGVTRHFTVDDLPKPGATPSASNSAHGVPLPDGLTPKVPDGFKVELVAQGIKNPRAIRFAPNGDLFVANSAANEVRVYRIAEGSAKPTEEGVFATDKLNQPYGIAFYPPGDNPEWVYVANADGLVRFPYKSGDLKAGGAPEVILEGIPPNHHWTRDVVFSPDGKTLYFSVGSGSNVAEDMAPEPEGGVEAWAKDHALGATWGSEERRADVLAFDPDGKNERVFATGLRNCSGMTLQPQTNALWCVVNERDALGDNLPFDYATSVKEGAFYGWPWYYIGDHEDPRLAGKRPDLKGQVTVPDVLFAAHSAPLNIAFYEGDQFPAEYKGNAFVAMHGSWNRAPRGGYKVVRLLFDADGKPTGEYQDFMTGFVISNDEVWGRPVGVAVAKDGSLFVSEDGSGTIWRVSYGK
ncbi:sorbosone dehydrogenase [Youhaiella tibetensis]|uniref:Sorbosone dehydrogenase family protein n=1 Tax=Paradevosia tibetensis TaxID=1447062 RepID=A0A5B9DQK2_9HYPH|nr:sorbosone dehydrogenase family protein [Youhaiella tibetensis]QEE21332.1 sorbosone dehydrogenase family protein [Youhaiella tibetensis]GGF15936.1 sorbosone dehydrogenase [Youhaiella tibetensis]